jgi:hypothetical protein
MGDKDPKAAKEKLFKWREKNPDKAFKNTKFADLINEDNDFKGYG